jgi:integrase
LNKDVKAWLDSYPPNPRQYRRRQRALERFEKSLNVDAPTLLEEGRRTTFGCQEIEHKLEEYRRALVAKGRSEISAVQLCREVRTFFTWGGARLARFPRDTIRQPPPSQITPLSQDDVNRMIQTRGYVQDQLVIAFLAQTGQRIGVLTGMKERMIKERGSKTNPYGLVEVNTGDLIDHDGRNVNRYRVRYRFVVGREAMKLVRIIRGHKGGWLFDIGERQMERAVNEAGEVANLEKSPRTGLPKRRMHTVHPNELRRYWKNQMKDGGVKDSDMLNFLMGNKASREFSEEEVLNAYKIAEKKLKLKFQPASQKRSIHPRRRLS